MKRFIAKVIFCFFCFVARAIPAYFLDPYNIFHWSDIRNNGVEPNKNYIKTKYILKNPNKYDGFLFGSSRVGAIHVENIKNKRIYNMTYSLGTPYEYYETLKTFIDNGLDISIVYIGIDSLSYTEDPHEHREQQLRASYQDLKNIKTVISLYCDPAVIIQSLPTIMGKEKLEGYEAFYTYGWWIDYNMNSQFDFQNVDPFLPNNNRMDDTLHELRDKYKISCVY